MAGIRVLACFIMVLLFNAALANALEVDNVSREKPGMSSGHVKVVAETKKMIGGRKMSVGVLSETSVNTKGSVEEDGFVAFNEDYHPPQHHPPRHN